MYLLRSCFQVNLLDRTDDKSILGLVMAWFRTATSHYLTFQLLLTMTHTASLGHNELSKTEAYIHGPGIYQTTFTFKKLQLHKCDVINKRTI